MLLGGKPEAAWPLRAATLIASGNAVSGRLVGSQLKPSQAPALGYGPLYGHGNRPNKTDMIAVASSDRTLQFGV